MVMHSDPTFDKADLLDRAGIERLINALYERVRADELLGFIFDQVARTDWSAHLPKMYAFWETVLFRTGGYTGNPIAAHARLTPLTAMGRAQFDRWLELFRGTVDDLFAGSNAEHIKNCAADMANVIHSRINGLNDPRADASKPTPEQRARYAAYRGAATA